ncbi:hypothetical protein [Paractinoplanes maris]|uniref:hypothetical protein n=1 Tax=Paractinoplanes maris TaxID=1734446 RepID=UPI0020210666|nr:hypothetical protein [Actinoplanes maris]
MQEEERLVSDLLDVERGSLRVSAGLPSPLVLRSLRRLIDEVGSGLPEYTGFQNAVVHHRREAGTPADHRGCAGETR